MALLKRAAVLIATASSGLLLAQVDTTIQPAPLLEPESRIKRSTFDALTPKQKAALALENTIGPSAVGTRLFYAGIDHMVGHPDEWPFGAEGYGMRVANRMGRLAISNSIRLGIDVAAKIDPRYDRCDCVGFRARTGHAWKRVFVARTDSGGQMLAIDTFAAVYLTPVVAYNWYPDRLRTTGNVMQSGTYHLGYRGATNMLREFWPEIKRTLRFGRN